MEIFVWMLTGSLLGWIAYSYLSFNAERGMAVSIVIGAVGGLIGGKVVAPMFTAGALTPGDFSAPALFLAAAVAAGLLAAGNLVYKRWGV
jgi:uncharacterized membrane protein YeaQ/YmgE (transglycosylase-associated protein family)